MCFYICCTFAPANRSQACAPCKGIVSCANIKIYNMVRRKYRKPNNVGNENTKLSKDVQTLIAESNELGSTFLELLAETATSKFGIGVAASALAMVWAALKDMAANEGVNVTDLFESELAYYEGLFSYVK